MLTLLSGPRNRELAIADARRNCFDELRHRVLTIGPHQLRERGKQARLRKAVAIDPVMARFSSGLVEVTERGSFLLVVGQERVVETGGNRMSHEHNGRLAPFRCGTRRTAWCSMRRTPA